MKKNPNLRSFLINIYGFAFCNKLLFLTPVYAIFMQSHGVSDMGLAVLVMLLSVGALVSQIRVPWLVNSIGAQRAIVLGQMLKIFGISLWIFWPTFVGFAIGMLTWGVQWAILAVAFEGMLYDELTARDLQDRYTKILSRRNVIQAVAIALSSFGSLIMVAGYWWVTLASVVVCMISCVFIMRVDVRAKQACVPRTQFRKMFRTGVRACAKRPCVFIMMILSLMVADIAYLDDYLGPIGLQLGIPVEYVGLVFFFALGCYALGQLIAPRLRHVRDWILYTSIGVGGGLYVLFSQIYSVPGLWILGAAYTMFGAINILLYSRFQHIVPTQYRSICLSLHNAWTHLVYILTCLIIGLGGSLGSWRYSIMILGLILCAIGVAAVALVPRKCPMGGHGK